MPRARKDPGIQNRVERVRRLIAGGIAFEGMVRSCHAQRRSPRTAWHAANVLGSPEAGAFPTLARPAVHEVADALWREA